MAFYIAASEITSQNNDKSSEIRKFITKESFKIDTGTNVSILTTKFVIRRLKADSIRLNLTDNASLRGVVVDILYSRYIQVQVKQFEIG